MKVSALNTLLSLALGCLALVSGLAAENSSLSDSNLETAETRVTPETSLSQTDLLRKQVSLDRETQKTLTESLVVSNAEAELFRRKYSELQLRMETLGVEAVSKDRAKLEQRLLNVLTEGGAGAERRFEVFLAQHVQQRTVSCSNRGIARFAGDECLFAE